MTTDPTPRNPPSATTRRNRMIVAGLAVSYGLLVAFGHLIYKSDSFWGTFGWVGAIVVGVSWLALMVVPWLINRSRAS